MKTYTNCLLQGYGVLPSAPRRIRVTGVQSRLAAVEWASPDRLGETVTSYDLSVRRLGNGTYARKAHVSSPYVLEGLEPGVDHEVFVEAVNTHGIGEPSERVIFRTLDAVEETELSLPGFQFNETTCCVDARLPDGKSSDD
ncbi:unnamed protein product [Darwinula stevensoni]|uniref:Fibronectin type-III domain-containing protein n=1 Tax=Darwinula stevensoni TaxID=69355 RepID=A0A7R9AJB1_9CRUS|nr:unnamed protein product [Darwinula stevensoni]CAG0907900.1 unnamed protein product [Darwinula stevensoni]